ncbi:uncharacterized protein LOC125488950 [Plutella xylostella]|uniref:uncharacterized protein LOC125488950 n=1 Tax=Plutella xylostella TaxID=51655 RepID=UPI0020331343|nr:uncharacterized protein LOC125488950 [Plutella xylostella]
MTSSDVVSKRPRKRGNPGANNSPPGSKRRVLRRSVREGSGEDDEILGQSLTPSNTRAKAALPKVDDLLAEMQGRPTADLNAFIAAQLSTVEGVADRSRNLKGTFVHSLRLAARQVQAATTELVERTVSGRNEERLERENAELRSQVAALSSRLEDLAKEVATLRQTQDQVAAPVSPVRPSPEPSGDWERRLMERIGSLMDKKLAAVASIASAPNTPPRSGSTPSAGHNRPAVGAVPGTQPRPKAKKRKRKRKKGVVETPAPVARSQPVPSSATPAAGGSTWATVVSRKAQKPKVAVTASQRPAQTKKVVPAKPPSSAAIAVTIREGADVTYAAVMAAAKERVRLSDCGISTVRMKRAVTGGLVLEVSGAECSKHAEDLAAKMREALADMPVHIARPFKTGEVRVMDLDEAISPVQLAAAIANAGECQAADIKVGEIRQARSGLNSAWVWCPLSAVRKLAAAKRIRVGWASARVEVLAARPMQCYRCLETGHVRRQCPNSVDRSDRCYTCGETGHRANQCRADRPKCPLCADLGRPSDHRLGSKRCTTPKGRKKKPQALPANPRADEPVPASLPVPTGNTGPREAMEVSHSQP